ncbi:MAG: signal peptide peptidase SppA, partial [Muribaculaceae bacterium]|nr:signal peptide peptidase SppA [Muribaculaceae bacterium]
MMKKFILMVCGSFVGASIALIVFGLCAMVMSFGIFFSMKKTQPIKKNSILCINLEGEIAEHSTLQPIDVIDLLEGKQQPSSLDNIVKALDVAKTNSKITAVLIDCQGADASAATLHTIRNAVADFKTCGKPVLAYAREGYSQGDYFVASAADKIYLNPVGMVDLHGLASFTPYFKKLLKNVGVEMQVVKVGTYKSAVEPFMIDSISPANREQQELYLKNIWGTMSAEIAADRHIPLAKLDSITNTILITQNAEELVNLKLVDELCYEPDFTTTLLDLCRLEDKDDLYFVYPEDVAVKYDYGKNKDGIVAVVYACGEIDGAEEGGIQSDDLVNILDELKDDEDIRGMVLRVNSPGGSAFGSEQIWKAVEDFKLTGKTVAVSMGDYAASGGYYISCGAHRIFADSTTLTGSIGIFGLIPCAQELMENKLGVTMSVVKTHSNADMAAAGIMSKKLSPTQLAAMQKYVENGYEL